MINYRAPRLAWVSTANVALGPSALMGYGGAPRYGYWYAPLLGTAGFDVHVLAPAGSTVLGPVTVHQARHGGHQSSTPKQPETNALEKARAYERFVAAKLDELDPDVVKLVSPSIYRLEAMPDRLLSRTVVALHMPLKSSNPRIEEWLYRHPEVTITAMSELHRADLGTLAGRTKVVRVGLPAKAYDYRFKTLDKAPARLRPYIANDLLRGPRLISQVDRVAPDKGQLITLRMFEESNIAAHGGHLLFAGSHLTGPNLAGPNQLGRMPLSADVNNYWTALMQSIRTSSVAGQIHVLPELVGHEVAAIYQASDLVMAPYGMAHGSTCGMNEFDAEHRRREALGFGPLIAQSCGARAVISDNVPETSVVQGKTGWRITDLRDGVHALQSLRQARRAPERGMVHELTVANHDFTDTAIGYAHLLLQVAEGTRSYSFTVDVDNVRRAGRYLERYEAIEAARLAPGISIQAESNTRSSNVVPGEELSVKGIA